jgi:hypothetical protein
MPRYALEIGKLLMRSEKPITPEEWERVRKILRERTGPLLTAGSSEVYAELQGR